METLYNLRDEELEPRLLNWARWCRSPAYDFYCRCHSLESRHVAPLTCWERLETTEGINLADAWAVEDAVKKLPQKYKKCLKSWHVSRLDVRWVAKNSGLHRYADVASLLRMSWALLKEELLMQERRKKFIDSHKKI